MKNKKSFWSKVEKAGEGMEIGVRCFLGLIFCVLLCALAFKVGNVLHAGIGVVAAIITFPVAFAFGFFWVEIKFYTRLAIQLFFGV